MGTTFGSSFTDRMSICHFDADGWTAPSLEPVAPLPMHPAAHSLHYGSTCFEGLKAYRKEDGTVCIFRLDRHIQRLQHSADMLCLPPPPTALLREMIVSSVADAREQIPAAPGALYIRPLLFGTEANIGNAAHPSATACLLILTSPVGDYFAAGSKALRLALQDRQRSTPDFGAAKTGGNYAAALRHIREARRETGADQVLFCPGGEVQETGAANFLFIEGGTILTKKLDGSILHGVTRDSLLTIAPELGLGVDERNFDVDELLRRAANGEAALSGTAAVLSGVGTFLIGGKEILVGNGEVGPLTQRLRSALTDIHYGRAEDRHEWLTTV